ncbi:MAG: cytochrome c oxidase assembly protein [Actinobacteria bacterium]|nr:cytochrome c oxidase assembly protein [Actinomycetota bacterium]
MSVDTLAELVGAVAPLLIAAAYLKRAQTLNREGRGVPAWRQLSFGIGMVVVLIAVGPLEGKAGELVLAHMGQHILLADVATLLIVLGLTGPLMQPLLANRLAHALRFLTHPVVAISLFTVNLFLWHSPPLYQAVLDSVPLHEAEHLSFIATGILLWMPLFGPLPKPAWFGKAAHVIYTVGIWLPAMVLANVLMWSDSVFYPDYSATAVANGIEPIADQSTAGAILMGECMLMALAIFAWVFLRWAREDVERQELLDLAYAEGVPLTPERAARAVAAGRGAALRERIEGRSSS